jgi:hypothetical protein
VNLTSYVLDASVALADLTRSIESAARTGGAFVPVKTCDGVDRSVLITPGLLVEIEPLDTAEYDDAGESADMVASYHGEAPSTFSGLEAYSAPRPSYFQW